MHRFELRIDPLISETDAYDRINRMGGIVLRYRKFKEYNDLLVIAAQYEVFKRPSWVWLARHRRSTEQTNQLKLIAYKPKRKPT